MEWHYLLRTISVVVGVLSITMIALSSILFWWELRNPENSHKLVRETSLEKYMSLGTIGTVGLILAVVVFGIITLSK